MSENLTKSFGDAMQALARRKAALAEGGVWPADGTTGPLGGYLVPRQLSLRIESILKERGVFFEKALRIPMTSATADVPALNLDTTTNPAGGLYGGLAARSEEHTSELQSLRHLVCRLLLAK